jgi:hypothetical protein
MGHEVLSVEQSTIEKSKASSSSMRHSIIGGGRLGIFSYLSGHDVWLRRPAYLRPATTA